MWASASHCPLPWRRQDQRGNPEGGFYIGMSQTEVRWTALGLELSVLHMAGEERVLGGW